MAITRRDFSSPLASYQLFVELVSMHLLCLPPAEFVREYELRFMAAVAHCKQHGQFPERLLTTMIQSNDYGSLTDRDYAVARDYLKAVRE